MKNVHITPKSKTDIIEALDVAIDADKEFQVSITLFDASLRARQRALANIWYQVIDKDQGYDTGYAESFCKYHYGLKLAVMSDPELDKIIRRMLDGYDYEKKLQIIMNYSEWFPVMREKKGLCAEGQAQYLTDMQRGWAEQGIILTSTNDKDLLQCKQAQI